MARGVVRIGGYDQRATPQSARQPYVQAVDTGGGALAAGLAQIGAGLNDVARVQLARAEDDARTFASRSIAEARAEAMRMRRTAFEEAPDGWRGVTERVSSEWGQLRDRALAGAPSPMAARFLEERFDEYQPLMLEEVAGQEQVAREGWQTDSIRSAVDTASGVLAADPGQYDSVRGEQLAVIQSLQNADMRRDLGAYAEEQFAVAAVSGLVERDPRRALTLLRDANAEGAVSRLTGPQRIMLENRAQAELNRRAAEAREARNQYVASLRDTVNAQNQLLSRGITPSAPLNVGEVAQLLGPDVAQNYLANLAGASAQQQMAGMPSGFVAQVAAGQVSPENSDIQNLLTVEARNAAARVLEQRRSDPGGYALQNGLMRAPDLINVLGQAEQSGDWAPVVSALSGRASDAVSLRERGVVPSVAPLSSEEARALGNWLAQQPIQARLGFFSLAQSSMNREGYGAMMRQLSQEGAGGVNAYAGYVNAQRTETADGPTVARRLLRGAEILSGAPGQEGRRTPVINMPSDDDLRSYWRQHVGQAFEGMPRAEESAFQAYRANYAALLEETGGEGGSRDNALAQRSLAAATGGVMPWNGRYTIMPWGMSARDFEAGVERGFRQWSFLADENPRNYDLRLRGDGRYAVYEGDAPLRNPITGEPVEIQVRR